MIAFPAITASGHVITFDHNIIHFKIIENIINCVDISNDFGVILDRIECGFYVSTVDDFNSQILIGAAV